jgi:DNA invertase Pin-like site-specific DNA recombinase
MRIGYARVSTNGQDLALQLDALRELKAQRIFEEKASAATAARPQLDACLSMLREGDELIVYRLDRLARSLADLLVLLKRIEDARATLRTVVDSIDTGTAMGRLLVHVLGTFGEFERAAIIERTRAGQAAAKARGTHVGRPPKLSEREQRAAADAYATGHVSIGELCRRYRVGRTTMKIVLRRYAPAGL